MKKLILSIGFSLGTMLVSFGQFTTTATSATFTGNTVPASGGTFFNYQPNNSGGTFYSDNGCSTVETQGGAGALGGYDATIYGATLPRTGVISYGGKVAKIYYTSGPNCVSENSVMLGFFTGTSIGGGPALDLSATANQTVKFTYQSDLALTLEFQLQDATYTTKLSGATVNILGDGASHTVTLNFSSNVLGAADMTNIHQASWVYTSATPSGNFGFSLGDIYLGSSAVTGLKNTSVIQGSGLFPNPAFDVANISLDLKSNADVKVILNDMLGNQVDVINAGNTQHFNGAFNISAIAKGSYVVTYIVNGQPEKVELLLVK